MCGVFGYVRTDDAGPDIDRLQQLAVITESRGEHAFGLAWVGTDGAINAFKRTGPAHDHLGVLERCHDAVVLIGHCRYATHGSPTDNRNNHPHAAGGGYLVHNGVVFNHERLIEQYALRMRSACDSEVLARLMARHAGTIARRAAWAAGQAAGDLAVLGVWRDPARLLVVRRGKPLHVGKGPGGHYFASLATGLPGRVAPVADHAMGVITVNGRKSDVAGAIRRLVRERSRMPAGENIEKSWKISDVEWIIS